MYLGNILLGTVRFLRSLAKPFSHLLIGFSLIATLNLEEAIAVLQ